MKDWILNQNGSARGAVLALLTAAVLTGGWVLPACSAPSTGAVASADGSGGGDEVMATVMGENITAADVKEQASDRLDQVETQLLSCQATAKQQRHQVMESAIQQILENRMLEAEAEEKGVSVEDLQKAEIADKVTEVTDAEVDVWYTENQARVQRPKEQVAGQIKQYLQNERQQTARADYMKGLRKKYSARVLLDAPRVEVAATGPSKGPDDAPVTIIEFSDFECPFCSRVNPTLAQVREEYGDKVRIVFRQFPLSIHANAQKAAEASLCAHDQDKFWEMHDLMFEKQRELGVDQLKAQASQLGLDTEAFNECLDSDKYAQAVKDDMKAGAQAGVSGTPAMFINGRSLSGAVPFEQVAKVIDDELERKGIAD
ncbi:MAG: thioredoxin domain-containing protein [Acidobacteriota bacterium]